MAAPSRSSPDASLPNAMLIRFCMGFSHSGSWLFQMCSPHVNHHSASCIASYTEQRAVLPQPSEKLREALRDDHSLPLRFYFLYRRCEHLSQVCLRGTLLVFTPFEDRPEIFQVCRPANERPNAPLLILPNAQDLRPLHRA